MFRRSKPQTTPTIFEYYNDESSGAIEFRRLVRNIMYRGNPSEVKSILVTSATKHEGKSLVASNLAIAMAKRESDKQVLLIDCDLRRPVIHSLFGMEREPGFADLITLEAETRDVIHDSELANLKIISSGEMLGSPSHWFANVKDVLDKCKEQFDVLICDAPPVVPVDDTAVIAPHLDGVLMVVLAGKTDRMVVKRAIDILNDAKAEILGVALNDLNGTLPYYYNYKYYGYKYKSQRENT